MESIVRDSRIELEQDIAHSANSPFLWLADTAQNRSDSTWDVRSLSLVECAERRRASQSSFVPHG